MRFALTSDQMSAAEDETVRRGVSLATLMRAAGKAVAETVLAWAPDGPVTVMAGKGNNGGDGWVAASRLQSAGRLVHVLAMSDPREIPEPAASAASEAIEGGVPWSLPESSLEMMRSLVETTVCVDALLGTGLHGNVGDPYAAAIAALNDSDAFIVSVDIPSGVEADTARVMGTAVAADMTLALGALKPGLVMFPGARLAGRVLVADIGIPAEVIDRFGEVEVWDPEDYAPLLPLPLPEDHKGSRGRVLVVGGAPGMTGAVRLACSSALRSGAGYVVAAAPSSVASLVDAGVVPAVTLALSDDTCGCLGEKAIEQVTEALGRADALVLGPGLGRGAMTGEAVREIARRATVSLLLDADGIAAFSGAPELLASRSAATLITPHPGEMAALLEVSTEQVQTDRLGHAERAAAITGSVCLLKGARTVVSDGHRSAVNMSGNPGMATAGSGDVLAGIAGVFMAQGLAPFEAAALAAWVHGRAGDLGAEALTETSLTAEDLVDWLPAAFSELV